MSTDENFPISTVCIVYVYFFGHDYLSIILIFMNSIDLTLLSWLENNTPEVLQVVLPVNAVAPGISKCCRKNTVRDEGLHPEPFCNMITMSCLL